MNPLAEFVRFSALIRPGNTSPRKTCLKPCFMRHLVGSPRELPKKPKFLPVVSRPAAPLRPSSSSPPAPPIPGAWQEGQVAAVKEKGAQEGWRRGHIPECSFPLCREGTSSSDTAFGPRDLLPEYVLGRRQPQHSCLLSPQRGKRRVHDQGPGPFKRTGLFFSFLFIRGYLDLQNSSRNRPPQRVGGKI